MEKQEYQHIRNLAWDLLIDSQIKSLPVDISKIAKLYNINYNKTSNTFNDALTISYKILEIFGYNANLAKHLTVRILCPMIVIKKLDIKTENELSIITELPIDISRQRFDRYKMLLKRNAFETSDLESKLLLQFKDWIDSYKLNS